MELSTFELYAYLRRQLAQPHWRPDIRRAFNDILNRNHAGEMRKAHLELERGDFSFIERGDKITALLQKAANITRQAKDLQR